MAADCAERMCEVEKDDVKEKTVRPPKLYDLTTLQREANRMFGYTAQQTLDAVQEMYEQKLVTYPRTDKMCIRDSISPTQLSYVTNSNEGEGLLFYGNVIIPFVDRFPKNSLYKIMTTRLEETSEAG